MTVEIGSGRGRTIDTSRGRRARREHPTRRVEAAAAAPGVDAMRRTSQEVLRWNDDLAVAKETRKFVFLESEKVKLLLERSALHQGEARLDFGVVDVLFEESGVTIVVRASKKYVAAVVIVEVELERFCPESAKAGILNSGRLTSYLSIRPILSRSNIRKIAKRLAPCKATRELLDLARVVHYSSFVANIRQSLQIGVDAHDDLCVGRAVFDILLSPLGHSIAEVGGSLTAAFFAEAQELVIEDHAIAVDKDQNERVAILHPVLAMLRL